MSISIVFSSGKACREQCDSCKRQIPERPQLSGFLGE
jgi:hypothetical protein